MNQRKWIDFFINSDKAEPTYDASLIAESMFDKLDLTHLSEEQIKLLMEGRKENVLKKYKEIVSYEALDMIVDFDEQHKYKHFAWAAKQLAKLDDVEQEEGAEEMVAALTDFVAYSKLLKKKDINQYKTVDELTASIHADVIAPRIEKARKDRMNRPGTKEMIGSGQATVVYEDERFFVVRPSDTEASCHFGSKTKWCIAQHGNSYFRSYTESEGKIFYFMKDDSLKNEDDFYKIAIQISYDGDELVYETFWDRYDESYDAHETDAGSFAMHMSEEMGIPMEKTEEIMYAISEHAEENKPESPLAELDQKIYDGEYSSGYLDTHSDMDDYGEGPYLSVNTSAYIPWEIKNQRLIDLIESGELDMDDIAERLQDEINENLFDSGTVAHDMFDDMGVETYHMDVGNYSDGVEVTEDTQKEYVLNISVTLREEDWGGTYGASNHYTAGQAVREAEGFLENLKSEWGEENMDNIQKGISEHFYRLFPEVIEDIDEFRALKKAFTDGTHEMMPGKTNYQIWNASSSDDEDNEGMSELLLRAHFKIPLHPKHIEVFFPHEEITNANGQKVRVLKSMWSRASLPSFNNIKINEIKEAVANIVKAIWEQSRKESDRQIPLNFGDGKDYSKPTLPVQLDMDDFNIDSPKYSTDTPVNSGSHPPSQIFLQFSLKIEVAFHKSLADMIRLIEAFKIVNNNYDRIEDEMGNNLQKFLWLGGVTPENADVETVVNLDNPRSPRVTTVTPDAIEESMTSSYWLLKEVERMFKS